MNRRKAMKLAAGSIAAGGIGILTLSNAFKTKSQAEVKPRKLDYKEEETNWKYFQSDPAASAASAYKHYDNGSCMYAIFRSVVSPIAEKLGEPYASFPYQMMKYGHGGIGGFGTVCGALNGAAAIVGLFVADKKINDTLITDLFQWYEKAHLPEFQPQNPKVNFIPVASASNSTICHASITSWGKASGYKADSDERKERCRRLTSDVAAKVTVSLNNYFSNSYIAGEHSENSVGSCMTCHGNEGKLANTAGKMNCNSCHTESVGHKVFSDIHYKLMK